MSTRESACLAGRGASIITGAAACGIMAGAIVTAAGAVVITCGAENIVKPDWYAGVPEGVAPHSIIPCGVAGMVPLERYCIGSGTDRWDFCTTTGCPSFTGTLSPAAVGLNVSGIDIMDCVDMKSKVDGTALRDTLFFRGFSSGATSSFEAASKDSCTEKAA